MKTTAVILGLAALTGIGFGFYAYVRAAIERDAALSCPIRVTRGMLEEGVTLGTGFMIANQQPEGNFAYEYDWIAKRYTQDDNAVRQAGATWGLSLSYRHNKEAHVAAALDRALGFFASSSKTRPDGARFIAYPGESEGSLGTVALVALAHIEYLSADPPLSPERRAELRAHLDQYLQFITGSLRSDLLFASKYDAGGKPFGKPSPYYDGEALLALVKAARYAGYEKWEPQIKKIADAGYEANVRKALAENPDSDTTKGYYQWSSMAYHEMTQTGWSDTKKYGDRLIELAHWMIDDHRVLARERNTAYAYEGIVSAYAYAKENSLRKDAEKFRCAIEEGLGTLMTWQVGASHQNAFIAQRHDGDPLANGGVQNHPAEAPLRIDVTQHQAHAMILALRHLPL